MRDGDASRGFALARWVGLAIVLPALIAVALLGKDTLMVVERSNEVALKRDAAAIERGLRLLGEFNGSEVLTRATQHAAFRNVVVAPHPDWIRENLGSVALASEGVQQLYIVEPGGRVSFSSLDDGPPAPERVAGLLGAAARSMDLVRELYGSKRGSVLGITPRRSGSMSDGLYVNDIVMLDGLPTLITVAPFAPDIDRREMSVAPTLLVGAQPMTRKLLDKLEALSHVEGLRLITKEEAGRAGAEAHPIRDSLGNVVTYAAWIFSPPGYAILRAALPAIALSLGVIALLTLLGAVTVRRLTRQLAESEQAAVHSARHDAATGLANRGWFMRVFSEVLAADNKTAATYAVLLIDCDHFKSINDTLGHAAGDAVLQAIATRLKALDDHITIAARLGGDEFAVVTAPLASAKDAAQQVRDIQDALTASVLFDSYVIIVGVSVGAAVFEAPSALSIDTWLARADVALYRAKRDGRGCARIYDVATDTGEPPLVPGVRNPANDRLNNPERAA